MEYTICTTCGLQLKNRSNKFNHILTNRYILGQQVENTNVNEVKRRNSANKSDHLESEEYNKQERNVVL